MTWTHFYDTHSGGDLKEDKQDIFIEAPEDEAVAVFFARFGHNPRRVSCTCCGEDYIIEQYDTLAEATKFYRTRYDLDMSGTRSEVIRTISEYLTSGEARFIFYRDITDADRATIVPQQGYVWID